MADGSALDRIGRYFWHNRIRMVIDLLAAFVIVFGTSTVVAMLGWPEWVLYLVLIAAVIGYVVLMPSWERPDERP